LVRVHDLEGADVAGLDARVGVGDGQAGVANAQGADLVGGEEGLEVIGVGGVWRRGQRGTEGVWVVR
jgi:hypothetical protein